MLVLTRKPDQAIILRIQGVPGDVVVKVLSVDRDRVKIGIEAPKKEVEILRDELLNRPKPEKEGQG